MTNHFDFCSPPLFCSATEDMKFIKMLQTLQKNKSLYFSYSIDLTKRVQVALKELVA